MINFSTSNWLTFTSSTRSAIRTWYGCVRRLMVQLSVKNCFVRGSVVRYIQLPKDAVDTELLQDATRKEAALVMSQQKSAAAVS